MDRPDIFSEEDWEYGYINKHDALKILGLRESSLDKFRKKYNIKKGYEEKTGNGDVTTYRLKDFYRGIIDKKKKWPDYEPTLIPESELDDGAEYVSKKKGAQLPAVNRDEEMLDKIEQMIPKPVTEEQIEELFRNSLRSHSVPTPVVNASPAIVKSSPVKFTLCLLSVVALMGGPWLWVDGQRVEYETQHTKEITDLQEKIEGLANALKASTETITQKLDKKEKRAPFWWWPGEKRGN